VVGLSGAVRAVPAATATTAMASEAVIHRERFITN
jgi:hypothetical protein